MLLLAGLGARARHGEQLLLLRLHICVMMIILIMIYVIIIMRRRMDIYGGVGVVRQR